MAIAFSAGALSGAVAATFTLPFDVVKTRQQSLLGQFVEGVFYLYHGKMIERPGHRKTERRPHKDN